MTAYYHYTCSHGHERIRGVLLPASELARMPEGLWQSELVWCTDLAAPNREALGLTNNLADCDRTAYRYRVLHPEQVQPWTKFARSFSRETRDVLEMVEGAMPQHWFVGTRVDVIYDPRWIG